MLNKVCKKDYNIFASTNRDYQTLAQMLKFISSWLNVKLATVYKRLGSHTFREKNKQIKNKLQACLVSPLTIKPPSKSLVNMINFDTGTLHAYSQIIIKNIMIITACCTVTKWSNSERSTTK